MKNKLRIDNKIFIPSYKKLARDRGLNTITVAKNAGLSPSYAYHIVSSSSVSPAPKAVRAIGKGLNLSQAQINNWIHGLIKIMESNTVSTPNFTSLADLINSIMRRRHISVKSLVRNSGISRSTLKDIRSGKLVNIDKVTLARLANAFNMDVQVFLTTQQSTIKHIKEEKLQKVAHKKHLKQNRQRNKVNFNVSTLAEAIKGMLEATHKSATTLAKESNVNINNIFAMLAGRGMEYASVHNLHAMAKVFNLPSNSFIIAKHNSLKQLALNVKNSNPAPNRPIHNNTNNTDKENSNINHHIINTLKPKTNTNKGHKLNHSLRPDVRLVAYQMNHLSLSDVSIINLLIQRMNRSNH